MKPERKKEIHDLLADIDFEYRSLHTKELECWESGSLSMANCLLTHKRALACERGGLSCELMESGDYEARRA